MIVYLHEGLGNMARELLGCILYKIIEMGSSSSLNKTVNFMDLVSSSYFVPSPPCFRGCAKNEVSALMYHKYFISCMSLI